MTSSWCARIWTRSPSVPEQDPFVGVLVRFAHELRLAGLAVGSGDVLTYCAAMAPLDPSDLLDLFWAGRTTLVSRREDLAIYDEVFKRFFLGGAAPTPEALMLKARITTESQTMLTVPGTDPDGDQHEEEAILGIMASDAEALKHKAFAACTPDELAALRRIMAGIRLTPPKRRTRRTSPAAFRPRAGHAPDDEGVDADARRSRRAVLAPAEGADASAHPHPRRLGVDGGLLTQPPAVRIFRQTGDVEGRGILLRDPTHPYHQGAGPSQARSRAAASCEHGVRLGWRDQNRRFP